MTNIRFRALRVTLHRLEPSSNVAAAKSVKELTEVASAVVFWKLSTIPTATITLPLGVQLDAKGAPKDKNTFAYTTEFQEILTERIPVGLYVSVEAPEDTSQQHTRYPDEALEPNTSICIFKGYAEMPVTAVTAQSAICTLQIIHWLSDLTVMPMLHRLSHPENPLDVATAHVYKYEGARAEWLPADTSVREAIQDGAVVAGIKAAFQSFLGVQSALRETLPGKVSQRLLDREQAAFNNLIGSDSATLPNSALFPSIRDTIVKSLTDPKGRDGYYATPWSRLTGAYLPAFMLTCVPLVDKAIIIPEPSPGIRGKPARVIAADTIVSSNVSKRMYDTISCMLMTPGPGEYALISKSAPQPILMGIQYPPQEKVKPGVIKVCKFPTWLESVTTAMRALDTTPKFASEQAIDAAETEGEAIEQKILTMRENIRDVCERYVKSQYLSEVLKYNSMVIRGILRFDVVPGMIVQLEGVKDNLTNANVIPTQFGTVTEISIVLSTDNLSTEMKIGNIRTEDQLETEDNKHLLYAAYWDGEDSNLYIKE